VQRDSARLTIPLGGTPTLNVLDGLMKNPFYLGQLSYQADTPFERDEFLYLMGLEEGSLVTIEQIKKGISYLAKKNKFNVIHITITTASAVNNIRDIHLRLESFWLVKHISVSGILNGRDT
jgi:hypothetical protein